MSHIVREQERASRTRSWRLSPIEGIEELLCTVPSVFRKRGTYVSIFASQMSGKARAVGGGEIPSPLDGDASESSESSIQDASEDTSSSY